MVSWAPSQLSATRRQRRHVPHNQRPSEFVRQRNERERRRVDKVNEAFLQLSRHLPTRVPGNWDAGGEKDAAKGVSKINTLRAAIDYIGDLQRVLQGTDPGPTKGETHKVEGCRAGNRQCIGHDYNLPHGMLVCQSSPYRSSVIMPCECPQPRYVHGREQYCHLEHSTFVTGITPDQLFSGAPIYNPPCCAHMQANVHTHFN